MRADIQNAEDFFARRGVQTLGLRRTFNLVTRDKLVADREETDADVAAEVRRLLEEEPAPADTANQGQSADGQQKQADPSASDEAVFAQAYIPRTLDQVYDVERDVARVLRGEGSDLIYADLTGVANAQKSHDERTAHEGAQEASTGDQAEEVSDDDEGASDASEDSDEEDGEATEGERKPRGKKFEDKDEKKARYVGRSLHMAPLY